MARPSSYPRELRERAVGMVAESRVDYASEFEAIKSVASKLGIGSAETLRKWVRQAEIDGGSRRGVNGEESAQLKALKKENAELRRANEILKAGGCRTNRRLLARPSGWAGVAAGESRVWLTTSSPLIVSN